MTQQERQVIEEAAIDYADRIFEERLGNIGAKNGFKAGADFALSELRKPSEEPKKIEGIPEPLIPLWEKIISLDSESINVGTKNWIIASLIDGYNVGVAESEPIGQTDEDLIQKITEILKKQSADIPTPYGKEAKVLFDSYFKSAATEIAKLLPQIPTYYPYDTEMFQELFNYMANEHDVNLLESEMDQIMNICLKVVGERVEPYSPSGENGVNVKSALSELVSLQAFVLKNLISDSVSDYNFPDSTSRATIRNVMKIIHDGNERIRDRIRKSIRISNAENHSVEPTDMVVKNDVNTELLEALKRLKTSASRVLNVLPRRSLEGKDLDDTICEVMDAITNAEKQMNHDLP